MPDNDLRHITETARCVLSAYWELGKPIQVLKEARDKNWLVLTFGNGGSHSTASHFANDLLKACGMRAICISDMIPTILAYNNDDGKPSMFSSLIEKFSRSDYCVVLVAFSCSGNSVNVVEALRRPPTLRQNRILFTGNTGGVAQSYADIVLKADSSNIRIQETVHLAMCHAIVEELMNGTNL